MRKTLIESNQTTPTHISGLVLNGSEEETNFFDVPPVRFVLTGKTRGDLIIDGHDFGWYLVEDARKIAAYFGCDLVVGDEDWEPPKPNHARREP